MHISWCYGCAAQQKCGGHLAFWRERPGSTSAMTVQRGEIEGRLLAGVGPGGAIGLIAGRDASFSKPQKLWETEKWPSPKNLMIARSISPST